MATTSVSVKCKTTQTTKKKIPEFKRKDWHKKIKLGSTVKKNRKWRHAYGRHNKIRLGIKGHGPRPKIGYSESKELRGKVEGIEAVRVENVMELARLEKNQGVIIGSVGAKKKKEIIAKANEMNLKILNKYLNTEKEL